MSNGNRLVLTTIGWNGVGEGQNRPAKCHRKGSPAAEAPASPLGTMWVCLGRRGSPRGRIFSRLPYGKVAGGILRRADESAQNIETGWQRRTSGHDRQYKRRPHDSPHRHFSTTTLGPSATCYRHPLPASASHTTSRNHTKRQATAIPASKTARLPPPPPQQAPWI